MLETVDRTESLRPSSEGRALYPSTSSLYSFDKSRTGFRKEYREEDEYKVTIHHRVVSFFSK